MSKRLFLLSPANCGGIRAGYLLRRGAKSALAARLRDGGAGIGEVYTFMSGLYFRGKLEYARAFGAARIIVPGIGLLEPDATIDLADLRRIRRVPVDPRVGRYVRPLLRDALTLEGDVVLLGSIVTAKYLEPLSSVFGERLHVPKAFVGRGDMERGALMLRAARSMAELEYVSAAALWRSREPRAAGSRRRGSPSR